MQRMGLVPRPDLGLAAIDSVQGVSGDKEPKAGGGPYVAACAYQIPERLTGAAMVSRWEILVTLLP